MAVDDKKLEFSSLWDIDQLHTTHEASLTAATGNTTVMTLPTEFATVGAPVVEGVFRTPGGTWQQFGLDHHLRNNRTTVWITNPGGAVTMDVRIYVYTDTVEY